MKATNRAVKFLRGIIFVLKLPVNFIYYLIGIRGVKLFFVKSMIRKIKR